MKNYSICAWRVKIMAFVPVVGMACCRAYASNLTKRSLPVKALVYCSETRPTGFDPSQYEASPDYTVATTLFNRLLEYKRDNINKIEHSLAERWEVSEDRRVYTFHLRRGVKFHTTPWFKPTRDFNEEDVLFTFERMRNPNMPFYKAYPVEFPDFQHGGFSKAITQIEALDDYTVRFTPNSRYAPFLSNLAMPLHRFFLLNTLHNCWKGGSRQRSIRNQSAQVRLFSANMIKIRSFISTAIQRIGNPMMCGCLS